MVFFDSLLFDLDLNKSSPLEYKNKINTYDNTIHRHSAVTVLNSIDESKIAESVIFSVDFCFPFLFSVCFFKSCAHIICLAFLLKVSLELLSLLNTQSGYFIYLLLFNSIATTDNFKGNSFMIWNTFKFKFYINILCKIYKTRKWFLRCCSHQLFDWYIINMSGS